MADKKIPLKFPANKINKKFKETWKICEIRSLMFYLFLVERNLLMLYCVMIHRINKTNIIIISTIKLNTKSAIYPSKCKTRHEIDKHNITV